MVQLWNLANEAAVDMQYVNMPSHLRIDCVFGIGFAVGHKLRLELDGWGTVSAAVVAELDGWGMVSSSAAVTEHSEPGLGVG